MVEQRKWKTDGTPDEILAEARRALADPTFPVHLRDELARAVTEFERGAESFPSP